MTRSSGVAVCGGAPAGCAARPLARAVRSRSSGGRRLGHHPAPTRAQISTVRRSPCAQDRAGTPLIPHPLLLLSSTSTGSSRYAAAGNSLPCNDSATTTTDCPNLRSEIDRRARRGRRGVVRLEKTAELGWGRGRDHDGGARVDLGEGAERGGDWGGLSVGPCCCARLGESRSRRRAATSGGVGEEARAGAGAGGPQDRGRCESNDLQTS